MRVTYAGIIGLFTLAAVFGIGLLLRAFETPRNGYAGTLPAVSQFASNDVLSELNLFAGWEHPEVVLVLSGEQHGYLQPCGCTSPQYGGLTRRCNLIQALRQRWPVVAADLGDMNQLSGPQALLKYEYAMKAHNLMGYTAVNVGEYESNMPLTVALAQYALNNPAPCVVDANLLQREKGEEFHGIVFRGIVADKQAGPKVGIFGLTGSSVEKKIRARDPMVKFSDKTAEIIVDVLRTLKSQKAEFTVLLYQGSKSEAVTWAKLCAKAATNDPKKEVAPLNVILCVSSASEPPSVPTMEGDTMIVEVGHKGRYVGVVGAFRQSGPQRFDLRYQLVSIEPKLDTPFAQEKGHKLMALLEEYAAELKNDGYLAKYKKVAHPVQHTPKGQGAEYVGSASCKSCHGPEFAIWEKSKHAHAYPSLVNAKNPSLRQFDGECVVCHTVGFGYKSGFENLNKTPNLIDVGCESCHGPSSEHVRKPRDPEIHLAINPYKFRGKGMEQPADKHKRFLAIDSFCQKCHDQDNDNRFDFDKDWPKIVHMTPPVK
jgi:hypothetical protein